MPQYYTTQPSRKKPLLERATEHKWGSPDEASMVMELIDTIEGLQNKVNSLTADTYQVIEGFRALQRLSDEAR